LRRPEAVADLDTRFAITGIAKVVPGNGGLSKVVVTVSMLTESDDDTRKWWPYEYRLVCRATFGAQLKVELIVTNICTSSFLFKALHAYFAVGDAETAYVRGLDGTQFINKTHKHARKKQVGDVRIASETDSVYLDTATDLELLDPTLNHNCPVEDFGLSRNA
jgi:glucose-6-phosphate 1-epimerase